MTVWHRRNRAPPRPFTPVLGWPRHIVGSGDNELFRPLSANVSFMKSLWDLGHVSRGILFRHVPILCLKEHKMGTRLKCSHFLFPFYVWRNIMYVCREHKMGTCLKCLQIVFPFYYLDTIDPPLWGTSFFEVYFLGMFPFYVWRNIKWQHNKNDCRLCSHFLVSYDLYNIDTPL